jgi:hypothetical protein
VPLEDNSSDKPALPEKMGFEELMLLDVAVLQTALSRVPDPILAQAIQNAPRSICYRILTNISARRREMLQKEILNIGKLPEKTIETARKNMIKFVLNIQDAEETDSTEVSSVVSASVASDRSDGPNRPDASDAGAAPRRITQKEFVAFLTKLREQNPVLKEIAEQRRDAVIKYWLGQTIRLMS